MELKICANRLNIWNKHKKISEFPLEETSDAIRKMVEDKKGEYRDCFSYYKRYYSKSKRSKDRNICVKLGIIPESYKKKEREIKKISLILIRGNESSAVLEEKNVRKLLEKTIDKQRYENFEDSLTDRFRDFKVEKKDKKLKINNQAFKIKNLIKSLTKSMTKNSQRVTKIKNEFQINSYKDGLKDRPCLICSQEKNPCKCFRSIYSSPLYIVCDKCLNRFVRYYLKEDEDIIKKSIIKSI